MTGHRVTIVGATGAVGQTFLRVLADRNFNLSSLKVVASDRSMGKTVHFKGEPLTCQALSEESLRGSDVVFFSAGSSVSLEWAPVAAKHALVIDNSSAYRMDPEVPLCVPEVNLSAARKPSKNIIANPNCSTIQLTVTLAPLRQFGLRRVIVNTYQSISGAGARESERLKQDLGQWLQGEYTGPRSLAGNLLMEWKRDSQSLHQEEELKIVQESRRILEHPDLAVSVTTVRVPVLIGHGESVGVECTTPLNRDMVASVFANAAGITLMDDFIGGQYPTPIGAAGQDQVLVGRLRNDLGCSGGIQYWAVADNLRKGAAANAVQIAEQLL